MKKINYEFLEHTADLGIRIKAKTLKGLFENTAYVLFKIIAERISKEKSKDTEKFKILQSADSLEDLFINWLNELLSLSAIKQVIFFDFKIKELKNNNLKAEVKGENIKNYKVNTEIKAATYHQLKIEKKSNYYLAEVIFDV